MLILPPPFFSSEILKLYLLLCNVGRESANFKCVPKMEKVGTGEVGENKEV